MRSTSQRRLFCLPANTDNIIIFFSFFCICFNYLPSLDVLTNLLQTNAATPKPLPTAYYQPTLESMTVPTSHEAYQILCVSHVCRVQFKSKPRGVFMNAQQVNRSASAWTALMSNSHGINTTELSACPERTQCSITPPPWKNCDINVKIGEGLSKMRPYGFISSLLNLFASCFLPVVAL